MDKFLRYNLIQWEYQHQEGPSSQSYVFVTGDRRGKRLSFQRRSLKKHCHTSVAAATIEALIAIINVLEEEH
jgi:hypothetical protein